MKVLRVLLFVTRRLSVSHLLFGEDILLFCLVSSEECIKIMEILNLYEYSLGQQINNEKMTIIIFLVRT